MKLVVFGASGGVGQQVLEQAVAAGHDVTAVVRNAQKVAQFPVRVVTADVVEADPAVLVSAISGADAVLSAVGPANNAAAGVVSRATAAIIRAMDEAGVRRLIVVSAAPVRTTPSPGNPNPPKRDEGDGFFLKYVIYPIVKAVLKPQYADLALMEDALRASDLDWTAIRPVQLTDKPLTGDYRTALGENLPGGRYVSRADVAHCMLRALDWPRSIHQAVGMAN
ncbi:putative NADH-flavin reductase [Nocardia tenerifensis]|uniref:Putative NADH-flavin reductase n=1 Tax=Nocardia tenerifensis TaxID=228006 RepID=A0A318KAE1_9NOCA|nr:SDR family oxidoreductase [Nocardia tenerifensis]PXX71076.1 putative NADH-flavin reductase [Nocardia tenerifensis]